MARLQLCPRILPAESRASIAAGRFEILWPSLTVCETFLFYVRLKGVAVKDEAEAARAAAVQVCRVSQLGWLCPRPLWLRDGAGCGALVLCRWASTVCTCTSVWHSCRAACEPADDSSFCLLVLHSTPVADVLLHRVLYWVVCSAAVHSPSGFASRGGQEAARLAGHLVGGLAIGHLPRRAYHGPRPGDQAQHVAAHRAQQAGARHRTHDALDGRGGRALLAHR
eukprot:465807-Prymnesium_polylepis.2